MKKYILFAGILAVVVGGSIASAQYFSAEQATALKAKGFADNEITAINGIYKACQDLIDANPGNPGSPKTLTYAYKCDGKCYNTHGNDPDMSSWDVVGNSANCAGAPAPTGCNCFTAVAGDAVNATTIGSSRPEFTNTTLRLGSFGPDVMNLQLFLRASGYTSVVADGNFGEATETALKLWQASKGILANGVFGPQACTAALSTGISVVPKAVNYCVGHCVTSSTPDSSVKHTFCAAECKPAICSPACNVAR